MPKVAETDHKASSSIAAAPELFADAQKALMGVQAELLGHLKEAGEHWAALAQAEAQLGAEWLSKLPTLRTLPEAAEAFQQLAKQQTAIATQDGKKMLDDCQKCMMLMAKAMSAGWMPRSNGGT